MTSRPAHVVAVLLLTGGLFFGLPLHALAQDEADFSARCASWVAKKGYSRDYVYQRVRSLPPPRARWVDNIRPEELQTGDVVMTTLWPGHLGVVDEIGRDAAGAIERIRVSSFNYSGGQGWIDRGCNVTLKFGMEVSTWITPAEASGYWRPKSQRK
ncbi:MAG: hypothetical protein ACREUW_16470 [Burkholderiales bacterium]